MSEICYEYYFKNGCSSPEELQQKTSEEALRDRLQRRNLRAASIRMLLSTRLELKERRDEIDGEIYEIGEEIEALQDGNTRETHDKHKDA